MIQWKRSVVKYSVIAIVGYALFLTNPKPNDVYEMLAKQTTVEIDGYVVDGVDPTIIPTLWKVEHYDFILGSVFVLTPTTLGGFLQFVGGNPQPEVLVACGAANVVFPCSM